jgi:catechol-2,3-dioxygenase
MALTDVDVAHSLYQSDPDGNGVGLYAHVVEGWRTARCPESTVCAEPA